MSGVIIDFLGKIYVDDTDLIVTHPDLVSSVDIQEELRAAAGTWSAGLNATGARSTQKRAAGYLPIITGLTDNGAMLSSP